MLARRKLSKRTKELNWFTSSSGMIVQLTIKHDMRQVISISHYEPILSLI